MSNIPTDEQTTRRTEGISATRQLAPGVVHALTIVDGRGGSMRFEVGGGQVFWLAAGLRRLIGRLVPAGGRALKVQAGDHIYMLSRRAAWGENLICISELFDPSATITLNETTAEMLSALMEVASGSRGAEVSAQQSEKVNQ